MSLSLAGRPQIRPLRMSATAAALAVRLTSWVTMTTFAPRAARVRRTSMMTREKTVPRAPVARRRRRSTAPAGWPAQGDPLW